MIRRRAAARAVAAAAMLVATTAPTGAEPSPGAWVTTGPPGWPFYMEVTAFPDGTAYTWTDVWHLRLRSLDFGLTWTQQPLQPPETWAARYGNPKDGYTFAAGECGSACSHRVFRTGDGGATWRAVTRLPAPPRGVHQLSVMYYAVAPSGRTVVAPLKRHYPLPPCPSGTGRVWGPNETPVAVTHDRARTWSLGRVAARITTHDVTTYDDRHAALAVTEFSVPNGSVCTPGALVQWSPGLWLTRDGGRTWRRAPVRCQGQCLSVTYASPKRILVGDSFNTVHVSDDGGATFRATPLGSALPWTLVMDVSFTDADVGWAISQSGIWRTADGGRTWLPELSQVAPALGWYFVSAANRARAVASWPGGVLARVGPSPQ